jgi:hypothetical protein
MITYDKGNSNTELTSGSYHVMISKIEAMIIEGKNKLKVTFTLEDGRERIEWVLCASWVNMFRNLVDASGQAINEEGGEFEEQELVGLEGTLVMVDVVGTGKHEGKTFHNAESFTADAPAEVKKN